LLANEGLVGTGSGGMVSGARRCLTDWGFPERSDADLKLEMPSDAQQP
jgi:hypothetical protein